MINILLIFFEIVLIMLVYRKITDVEDTLKDVKKSLGRVKGYKKLDKIEKILNGEETDD